MRFVAEGRYGHLPARIEWEDGELRGDELAITEIEALVRSKAIVHLTEHGSFPASLADPITAEATIGTVLDRMHIVEGDEVEADQLPPGVKG